MEVEVVVLLSLATGLVGSTGGKASGNLARSTSGRRRVQVHGASETLEAEAASREQATTIAEEIIRNEVGSSVETRRSTGAWKKGWCLR